VKIIFVKPLILENTSYFVVFPKDIFKKVYNNPNGVFA